MKILGNNCHSKSNDTAKNLRESATTQILKGDPGPMFMFIFNIEHKLLENLVLIKLPENTRGSYGNHYLKNIGVTE
jgi:hypothetical protein